MITTKLWLTYRNYKLLASDGGGVGMEKLMMGVLILLTVLIILKQGLNRLNFWTLKQNYKLERQLAAQRRSDQTQDDVTDDEGRGSKND